MRDNGGNPTPFDERASVVARIVSLLLILALGFVSFPGVVVAQVEFPRERLVIATSKLAPYDLGDEMFSGMEELARLTFSHDPEVAYSARYIRVVAMTDLLMLDALAVDGSRSEETLTGLGLNRVAMTSFIENELESLASGCYGRDADSYRVVLGCYEAPLSEGCIEPLRHIIDAGDAGATAARILLLDEMVSHVEMARNLFAGVITVGQGASDLAACAAVDSGVLARTCRSAARDGTDPSIVLSRAIIERVSDDLNALRAAVQNGDPLALAATSVIDRARLRVGWTLFHEAVDVHRLADLDLPDTSRPPTPAPLELLIVSRSAVSVAIAPATVYVGSDHLRIEPTEDLEFPGRQVMPLPGSFRPAITPIPSVTTALEELRSQVNGILEPFGDTGPEWLRPEERPLGLLIDQDVVLADLARYLASARSVGFRRFAFLGVRADGQLASATAVTRARRESGNRPRPWVNVGPQEVIVATTRWDTSRFPRSDLDLIGQEVASHVNGASQLFTLGARPMMRYGMVYPCIDAVFSTFYFESRPFLFVLPP